MGRQVVAGPPLGAYGQVGQEAGRRVCSLERQSNCESDVPLPPQVVGSSPGLGTWAPERGVTMKAGGHEGEWTATLLLQSHQLHEFKVGSAAL